jgi:hypothetical protein
MRRTTTSVRPLFRIACFASICIFLLSPLSPRAADNDRPDAITVDGGRYYGPLVNGKLHGRGRIEWDNGARYDGDLENGLLSGRGRMKFGSGQLYEGEFRSGMMAGHGRLEYLDRSTYIGEFRKDFFNGVGRFESANGYVYEGAFENGEYHGQGRLVGEGRKLQGEFKNGMLWGPGELVYEDGRKYVGEFVRGRFQGKGRYEDRNSEVFEGDFYKDEFTGSGTHTRKDGARYEGVFLNWRYHGAGRYVDSRGHAYEGEFLNGEMTGPGRVAMKNGDRYEGNLKLWRPDGRGVMRLANGDLYEGGFSYGLYDGEGTLRYAKPRADGRTEDRGVWRYGKLTNAKDEREAKANVETALYSQRALLNKALASITSSDPKKINLYLLAVAGDSSQEVFRREVEFVRKQFDRRFGTKGRSLVLINSRNSLASEPMATVTSIREALKRIADRMDRHKDILFLFLTSHGSQESELVLNQNNMSLRGLRARELGDLLKETGIRWKVVVISACYSGGFIDSIRDDRTLIITAARHDRRSFGCADENDFTRFGRAFFKEALPQSKSFNDAFGKAESLIQEWEAKEFKAQDKAGESELSLPQIVSPQAIQKYLGRWWVQI